MLSSEYYNLSSENYRSWRDDCVSGEWVIDWTVACVANLELGLRWIHDKDFYFNYDDNSHINCLELGLRWLHDRCY